MIRDVSSLLTRYVTCDRATYDRVGHVDLRRDSAGKPREADVRHHVVTRLKSEVDPLRGDYRIGHLASCSVDGAKKRATRLVPKIPRNAPREIRGAAIIVRPVFPALAYARRYMAAPKPGSSALFRSLADTWANTSTPHGRLMLAVPGRLAVIERGLIRERTAGRRSRAVGRGVKLGRKLNLTPHQLKEAIKRRDGGEAVREIACSYNVHHTTISGLCT